MIRRFYSDTPNPATGTLDKVTALRDYDGCWIINKISKTVPVNGYFYDKPGDHIATVSRDGSKWLVKSLKDGNVPGFSTLSSAVQHVIERSR